MRFVYLHFFDLLFAETVVPGSAALNKYIYIFFSVPLNFIQNDYAKAGAGYVKGVENFKDVSHILNSFLLSRLPLYRCSFFFRNFKG